MPNTIFLKKCHIYRLHAKTHILYTQCEVLHLELVCCKMQQTKVPDQLLVCRIGDFWRTWIIPNSSYMSPSDPLIIQDQFYTIQNLQRSPIQQTSNWSGTFFCCFLQQTGSKISTASGQYLCSGKEFFNLCQYITFYIAARHNLSSIFDTTKVRPVFVDKMFTKFLVK